MVEENEAPDHKHIWERGGRREAEVDGYIVEEMGSGDFKILWEFSKISKRVSKCVICGQEGYGSDLEIFDVKSQEWSNLSVTDRQIIDLKGQKLDSKELIVKDMVPKQEVE